MQYGPIVSSDPDWSGLTESVPVIARDVPAFTVGTPGTYAITAHGYPVTPKAGMPSWLKFDSSAKTISGTPPAGGAGHYTLTFQGEDPTTTLAFDLVVANASPSPVPPSMAPMVTTNPTSQTIDAGRSVTLTASASGSPTPDVLWQASVDHGTTFANIPGATSATLTLAATGAISGDEYRAVFTNTAGQATTTAATLTVTNFAPVIEAQPASASVKAGSSVIFSVVEIADPAATVQWQVARKGRSKYKDIRGATSKTLSLVATRAKNGQKFRAVIANAHGEVISAAATLTVVKSRARRAKATRI